MMTLSDPDDVTSLSPGFIPNETRPIGSDYGVSGGENGVSPFSGSYQKSVSIQLPSFHSLTPQISLNYNSSSKGNGFLGVGWSLSGFETISQLWNRIFLNGNEIFQCMTGNESIGCQMGSVGGTKYYAKFETFQRIEYGTGTWTITDPDGSQTTFTNLVSGDNSIWGVSARVDVHGNRVDYEWNNGVSS